MKKAVSIGLIITMMMSMFVGCVISAQAESFTISFDEVLKIVENADTKLLPKLRESRYDVYMAVSAYARTNTGIDALLTGIDNPASLPADQVLIEDFYDIFDNKDVLKFALKFLRAVDVPTRIVAFDGLNAKEEFVGLNAQQEASLNNLYNAMVSSGMQAALLADHEINAKVLLKFFATLFNGTNSFRVTESSSRSNAILQGVVGTFDTGLTTAFAGDSVNGVAVLNGASIISPILDSIVSSTNPKVPAIVADLKLMLQAGGINMFIPYSTGGSSSGGGSSTPRPSASANPSASPTASSDPVVSPGPSSGPSSAPKPPLPDDFGLSVGVANNDPIPVPEHKESGFDDTVGHWAEDYIAAIKDEGIVKGMSEVEFGPSLGITREDLAVMICRFFGIEDMYSVDNARVFADNGDISAYAKNSIDVLVAKDIYKGYDDDRIMPKKTITRQELAALISRVLEYTTTWTELPYADTDQIGEWALANVLEVSELGIMIGRADDAFEPLADVTRAEVATIFYRLLVRAGNI